VPSIVLALILLQIFTLTDANGPTVTDPNYDALILSEETLSGMPASAVVPSLPLINNSGGKAINDIRRGKGWKELALIVVPFVRPPPQFRSTNLPLLTPGQYTLRLREAEKFVCVSSRTGSHHTRGGDAKLSSSTIRQYYAERTEKV
jgi:hypothetical protein